MRQLIFFKATVQQQGASCINCYIRQTTHSLAVPIAYILLHLLLHKPKVVCQAKPAAAFAAICCRQHHIIKYIMRLEGFTTTHGAAL
jgi:hypothetical protein